MSRRPRSPAPIPSLHRYLIHFTPANDEHLATPIGVTAFSIDDALSIIRDDWHLDRDPTPIGVDEDVDLSSIPDGYWKAPVGPTSIRGIWYPMQPIE